MFSLPNRVFEKVYSSDLTLVINQRDTYTYLCLYKVPPRFLWFSARNTIAACTETPHPRSNVEKVGRVCQFLDMLTNVCSDLLPGDLVRA